MLGWSAHVNKILSDFEEIYLTEYSIIFSKKFLMAAVLDRVLYRLQKLFFLKKIIRTHFGFVYNGERSKYIFSEYFLSFYGVWLDLQLIVSCVLDEVKRKQLPQVVSSQHN